MTKQLKLPQRAWFGDTETEISFPEDWQISVHGVAADSQNSLNDDEIGDAVRRPKGCPPLRDLARGRKEAVIIFDNLQPANTGGGGKINLNRSYRIFQHLPQILHGAYLLPVILTQL